MQLVELNTESAPRSGPALNAFVRLMGDIFESNGTGRSFAVTLKGLMEEAGLQDVKERVFECPHGITTKDEKLVQKSIESPAGAVGPLCEMAKGTLSAVF